MSNSLDPDPVRRFVGPDLGTNCLPRLSVDDTGRQRVEVYSNNKDADQPAHPISLISTFVAHCLDNDKSLVMRKTVLSSCTADQRLCFRYMDSTISILPKSEISSF